MNRTIRSVLCCLGIAAALLPPLASRAQDVASKELRLNMAQCIETALENNSIILQRKLNVDIADANLDAARNAFLPTVSSSWSTSRNISGPREGSFVDPATGLLTTSLGESRVSGSQRVSANFGMTVFNMGNIITVSARKKGLKASEMILEEGRQQVVSQVKQAYLSFLQAQKLMEVQQEQVRVSEESLRRNQTLYEIGSASIAAVYSARSTLENARVDLITRENNVEVFRYNLAFAMGLGTDVRVAPTAEEFTTAPEAFEAPAMPFSYEEALDRALRGSPDILSDKYSLLQTKDNLRATQYNIRFPTVGMSASYGWNIGTDENFRGLEDLFMKNYSYSVGMSVSLPLFQRMSTENSVKRQKLQYLQNMEVLDQTKRQKALDIKRRFLNLELYRRSIEANKAAVQASNETFKLQQERYNLGAATFLVLQQAQADLFRARSNLVQAIYNYYIELARLEQDIGGQVATGASE